MERKDLRIDDYTVVHCVSKELAKKVLKIAHDLGYSWKNDSSYLKKDVYSVYKGDTCYDFNAGKYSPIFYYEREKYKIISAEDFLKLHEADVLKTDNKESIIDTLAKIEELEDNLEKTKCRISHYQEKNKLHKAEITRLLSKVSELELKLSENPKKLPMYRGDKERGSEIIRALQYIGGVNKNKLTGRDVSSYYCLGDNNIIVMAEIEMVGGLLATLFELTELPTKKEVVEFTLSAEGYDRMVCRNYDNWEIEIFHSFHSVFWMDSRGNSWLEVLPFNEKTKKLIGTTNQPDVEYKFVECLTGEKE